MVVLRPFLPEGADFAALEEQSLREGHRMVRRLGESWRDGSNRFSRPGEMLLGAYSGPLLTGVGGRNIDPYRDDVRMGRIRHLYIRTDYRRLGVGRHLMAALVADADTFFDYLNVRAPPEAFVFYERLGFARVIGDETVTHRLLLRP
ncbi:GNAT family N-acetyltransferase [Microvirga puerhi]|uniref:GNAT family N-acetyltransferase n=1 Tax=Microvirga puerhi TaxID=2876078 RepID=A0ABS7VNF9_9HYPH|nr:GNAT family N-acetyltransferase [Microvirga puerhi]MBZ6077088.1 GNAT family N-acetyltransferase [Microvirga puerhi]